MAWMGTNNNDDDDDEFFGNDIDNDIDDDNNVVGDGMAQAELLATRERYFRHGFHETFQRAEQDQLQQGFEQGYIETFLVARRIGIRLGTLTFQHNSITTTASSTVTNNNNNNNNNSSSSQQYRNAARLTRNFLTKTPAIKDEEEPKETDDTENFLEPLESSMEKLLQEHNNNDKNNDT